jgi:hypothetical protein
MLSTILLLPQPLGPMTPVIPSSKFIVVLSAKLLKPLISNVFNLTVQIYFKGVANILYKLERNIWKYALSFHSYTQLFHRKFSELGFCLNHDLWDYRINGIRIIK